MLAALPPLSACLVICMTCVSVNPSGLMKIYLSNGCDWIGHGTLPILPLKMGDYSTPQRSIRHSAALPHIRSKMNKLEMIEADTTGRYAMATETR